MNYVSYVPFLKEWSNSKFITLKSPFLSNTDNYGLIGGIADMIRIVLVVPIEQLL